MTLPKCNFLVTHFQIFFVAINIPANDRQNINTFVPARYPTKQVFFLIQFIMIGGGLGSRGCTNLESGRRRGFNFCQKGFVPQCTTQSSSWVKMKMIFFEFFHYNKKIYRQVIGMICQEIFCTSSKASVLY